MKKLILSLAIVSLLVVPFANVALADTQQEPAVSTQEVHGNVPAQMGAAEAMTPAVHALVLAMAENHLTYDPQDSQFFWTSLYYMLSLYGQMDERAEFTDEIMTLPAEMVRDYAAALYPDVVQLPEIPQPIAQRISYNAASDCYELARGDEGLSQINVSQGSDPNTLTGTMTSLEDGSVLLSFEVQVSPRDSMFGYIISNLTISE